VQVEKLGTTPEIVTYFQRSLLTSSGKPEDAYNGRLSSDRVTRSFLDVQVALSDLKVIVVEVKMEIVKFSSNTWQ
jgi:hypothetical protein